MTFGNDYDVALISHLFKFRQSCCMFGLEVSCNMSQLTSSKVVRETENSSSPSCSLAWSSSLCSRPSPWGWGTHWYTNTLWCASCVCVGGGGGGGGKRKVNSNKRNSPNEGAVQCAMQVKCFDSCPEFVLLTFS